MGRLCRSALELVKYRLLKGAMLISTILLCAIDRAKCLFARPGRDNIAYLSDRSLLSWIYSECRKSKPLHGWYQPSGSV